MIYNSIPEEINIEIPSRVFSQRILRKGKNSTAVITVIYDIGTDKEEELLFFSQNFYA